MTSSMKFFTDVFKRAKQKIADIREESRIRRLLAKGGLVRVNENILTMERNDFATVEKVLETFHAGHYLVIIIGSSKSRACPKGVLDSVKLEFEDPQSLSGVLSACQSVNRWLQAHTKNVIVLCAAKPEIEKLLSCCIYHYATRGKTKSDKETQLKKPCRDNKAQAPGDSSKVSTSRKLDDLMEEKKGETEPKEEKQAALTEQKKILSKGQEMKKALAKGEENITNTSSSEEMKGDTIKTKRDLCEKKEVPKTSSDKKEKPEEAVPSPAKSPRINRAATVIQNRSWHRLKPSQRRFIRDFKIAVNHDVKSKGEPLVLKELVIERLPPPGESGAKISIIVMQKTRFVFSTMNNGGVIWLAASAKRPANACIPINFQIPDDCTIKVYHHPDRSTGSRQQKLLFKVSLYTDVARKKGYLLRFEKEDIDEVCGKSQYPDKFRVQALLEEPETKTPSPFADPNSKRANDVKRYWEKMKKRQDYEIVMRTDPLKMLEQKTAAAEAEKKKRLEAKASKSEQKKTTIPEVTRAASAPEPLDDLKLAQLLQSQFDMEAKTTTEAGSGNISSFQGDEEYARRLQRQINTQAIQQRTRTTQETRIQRLLRTGAIEPSQLNYEQLLELDNSIQRGLSSRNAQLISMLPEFEAKGKYVGQKCMVCFETFEAGESMRTLPCLHSFHRKCIDRWLSRSKKCPVCNTRVDELLQAAVIQNTD